MRDPIQVLTEWLLKEKIANQSQLDEIRGESKIGNRRSCSVCFAISVSGGGQGWGGRLCLK